MEEKKSTGLFSRVPTKDEVEAATQSFHGDMAEIINQKMSETLDGVTVTAMEDKKPSYTTQVGTMIIIIAIIRMIITLTIVVKL